MLTHPCIGFGLGLRVEHYEAILADRPAVDWFEALTENYLVPGGKPLHNLMRVRESYPLALHGVSMSIGSTAALDREYLAQVKALAARVEPKWISDHLCWTGVAGKNLHDLLPLPYTEEALANVVERVRTVQDILGRRILLENVSSYVTFRDSRLTEWEFLREVAVQADCLILLDINNIYVSAVNHEFAALDYLNAIPAERVQQMHLAGHENHGDYLIDTHDHPVPDPVWALYAAAVRRFGNVSTMIERDANIPPLAELCEELAAARVVAARALEPSGMSRLARIQGDFQSYLLRGDSAAIETHVAGTERVPAATRLSIYGDGYRSRLVEALAANFPVLSELLGERDFATLGAAYVRARDSSFFSIRYYGNALADFLASEAEYASAPVLAELARWEWAMTEVFDAADADPIGPDDLAALAPDRWADLRFDWHPSVRRLALVWNAPQIWKAVTDEAEPPEVALSSEPVPWLLWRQALRTYFRSLHPAESAALTAALAGHPFGELCALLCVEVGEAEAPAKAAGFLRDWIGSGLIIATR